MHTIQEIKAWVDSFGAPPPKGKAAKSTDRDEIVGVGRELDGRYWLRREYYVPEAFGDDDLSFGGSALKPRMGYTRRVVQIHDESFEALKERIAELGGNS